MTKGTQRRLTTIVAADIVDYSRLVGNDEEGTLAAQRSRRTDLIEPKLAQYHGRIVNTAGDSFLFEFSSAVDAVRCAMAVQEGMVERNRNVAADRRIEFRIGINVGDVLVDGDDLLGDGVNVAARLESIAEPGGICLSGNAREQIRQRLKLNLVDMGPQTLKNIAEPVRTYRITTGTERSSLTNPQPVRRWFSIVGVSLVVAIGIIAIVVWQLVVSQTEVFRRSASSSEPAADLTPLTQKRRLKIAVLPFETASRDAKDKWLGDGIAEDISIELSRFRDIGVAAHNSSIRYRTQPVNLGALKSELGADFVLQGSVRLNDDQLRLALQLVDTQSGTNSWAERYDRSFDEVFSVKADIINQIAARLVSEAQEAANLKIANRDPKSLDVFENVLRARWSHRLYTREGAFEAFALAERAVELDANYAAAWEILSRAHIQFYVQPYDRRRGDPETLERAITAARKAAALDVRSSMAAATLGTAQIWAGKHAEGLQDLRRAIELNPSDSFAFGNYADGLSRAGYQKEALVAWDEMKNLDPIVVPLSLSLIGRSHILLGDFQTAHRLTSECLRKAPKILPCHLFHIMAASGLKNIHDVEASAAAVNKIAPRFTVSGWRNIIKFGDPNEARILSDFLVKAGLNP